jgi:hypothetical protein
LSAARDHAKLLSDIPVWHQAYNYGPIKVLEGIQTGRNMQGDEVNIEKHMREVVARTVS